MTKAIALARAAADRSAELARMAVVLGCGLALTLAAQALPL